LPDEVYEISENSTNESQFIISKSDRTIIFIFQWLGDLQPGQPVILKFKVRAEYARLEVVKVIEYPLEIKFKI
jgi:hypothetical protein